MKAPRAKANPAVYCIEEAGCKRSRRFGSRRSPIRLIGRHVGICSTYTLLRYNHPIKMKFGVYIQVPFCQTKCTYCNFHTGVVSRERYEPYAAAVCREVEETAASMAPETREVSVDTVYFGGGTP